MRNNGLLQTIDRYQWCFLCVFEAGFEDVLKDIQRIYFTAVNGKSSRAIYTKTNVAIPLHTTINLP